MPGGETSACPLAEPCARADLPHQCIYRVVRGRPPARWPARPRGDPQACSAVPRSAAPPGGRAYPLQGRTARPLLPHPPARSAQRRRGFAALAAPDPGFLRITAPAYKAQGIEREGWVELCAGPPAWFPTLSGKLPQCPSICERLGPVLAGYASPRHSQTGSSPFLPERLRRQGARRRPSGRGVRVAEEKGREGE